MIHAFFALKENISLMNACLHRLRYRALQTPPSGAPLTAHICKQTKNNELASLFLTFNTLFSKMDIFGKKAKKVACSRFALQKTSEMSLPLFCFIFSVFFSTVEKYLIYKIIKRVKLYQKIHCIVKCD